MLAPTATRGVVAAPARLRSPYVFDARLNHGRGGYRYASSGRVAGWGAVREWLDGYIDSAREEARGVATALQNGRLTLAEAELRMRTITADAHLAAAVLEKGGFAQMSPADYGRVGRLLFNPNAGADATDQAAWGHYQYLRRLFVDVAAGRQPMDGRLVRRLMAYVETSRTTYHRAELVRMERLGFDQARRRRHARDSCSTRDSKGQRPGCIELAARGWMPIGEMVPIGQASCLWSCRCSISYKNSATGAVIEGAIR